MTLLKAFPTILLGALFLTSVLEGDAHAVPVQWMAESGGNGHWYDFIGNGLNGNPNRYTWEEARLDSIARGGYLATPTTGAEWAFMQSSMYEWVGDVDPTYNTCAACGYRSYQGWLGGFQNLASPSYSEPGGGWEWVTGEGWSFTAWSGGEPNDVPNPAGGEDFLLTWFHNGSGWNDGNNTSLRYYIEYDTYPIPEPSTGLLVGIGLIGLSCVSRRRTVAGGQGVSRLPANAAMRAVTVASLVLVGSFAGSASALPSIEAGLVAAWEFDGNANDLSGNGHHGSVAGAVPTDDRFGNANGAYSFAALAARIELSPVFSFHPQQLTYLAWIGGWQNTWGTIYGEFTSHGRTRNYFLAGGGQPAWELTLATYPPSGAADAHLAWGSSFLDEEWIQIAIVRNGDQISGYVNGVLQDTDTTVGVYSGSSPFVAALGSRYNPFAGGWVGYGDGTYQFRGVIDELYIYDRALSAVEIASLYAPIPEPSTGLLVGLGLLGISSTRRRRRRIA